MWIYKVADTSVYADLRVKSDIKNTVMKILFIKMDNRRIIHSENTCYTLICLWLFIFPLVLIPSQSELLTIELCSNGFVNGAPYMPVDRNLCIYHCAEEGTWFFMSKQTNFIKNFALVTHMIPTLIIKGVMFTWLPKKCPRLSDPLPQCCYILSVFSVHWERMNN